MAATTLCIAQDDATKSKSKQAGGSPSDQALIDNSRATWEAYKTKNVAAIKALSDENYVAYTLAGPSILQQDYKGIVFMVSGTMLNTPQFDIIANFLKGLGFTPFLIRDPNTFLPTIVVNGV